LDGIAQFASQLAAFYAAMQHEHPNAVGAIGGQVLETLWLPAGHKDRQIGPEFPKLMKNVPAILRIEVQIQENNVNLVLRAEQKRFPAGGGTEDFVVLGGKHPRQRLANRHIVLNKQQITLTNHLSLS